MTSCIQEEKMDAGKKLLRSDVHVQINSYLKIVLKNEAIRA